MSFITFEGMDGAGKTSTSSAVAAALRAAGHDVLYVDKKHAAFEEPYVRAHMGTLQALIWDYDQSAPIDRLGELHWLHLVASLFYTLDHAVIQPNLSAGRLVLVDNWIGKFLARYTLKGEARAQQARAAFADLRRPDLTLFLDVDPGVAARRKSSFTVGECGNLDGYVGATAENFIAYQSRIRDTLTRSARENGWFAIDTSTALPEQVTAAACSAVLAHVASRHGHAAAGARHAGTRR